MNKSEKIEQALDLIRCELIRADAKHGLVFASPHEGWAVIQEELDELWDDVKANEGRSQQAVCEAVQVGATAAKYILNFLP